MTDHDERRDALFSAAVEVDPSAAAELIDRGALAEAARLVESHPNAPWAPVLAALSSERAVRLFETLEPPLAARLLAGLDISRAAAVVSRLSNEARGPVLAAIDAGERRELEELMAFPPETAGRVMDPKVFAFRGSTDVHSVLERLRTSPWRRVFEVFVVDEAGKLEGAVALQEVAVAPPETRLETLKRPAPVVVPSTATREEVVDLLETRQVPALPVVDFDGRLLGVIRYQTLIQAAQAEASVDIQTMVGASKEERALSKVSFAVRKRLPWLQVNLGTAFLAASVVGLFESTIAQFTALAVLLPVVAGQSGNTGAQALAVTMRGLALREVRTRQWLPVVWKELRVGFLNGVAVAATTSLFVFLWSRSIGLALVIGSSMILSMAMAGLAGGAIPMVLTALGQDPAQSSSIILTTVTDVVGFFSFLGIATLLSGML